MTPEEYMPRVAANLERKCLEASKEVPFMAEGHAPYMVIDTYRDGHKYRYLSDAYPTGVLPDNIKYREVSWEAVEEAF